MLKTYFPSCKSACLSACLLACLPTYLSVSFLSVCPTFVCRCLSVTPSLSFSLPSFTLLAVFTESIDYNSLSSRFSCNNKDSFMPSMINWKESKSLTLFFSWKVKKKILFSRSMKEIKIRKGFSKEKCWE